MATTRTSVFISYSHADERWRQLVEKHLAPLRRDHHLRIWSDQDLLAGEPWLARIKRELATAKVGILLISANFMASDFIHSDELPPLLAAARQEGVTLLSVMVGYCHFANSPLSQLQAFNKPDRPLSALTTPQRDKEMARLCARLLKLFGLSPEAGVGKTAATATAATVQSPKAEAAAPRARKLKVPAIAPPSPAEAATPARAKLPKIPTPPAKPDAAQSVAPAAAQLAKAARASKKSPPKNQ